MFPDLFAAIGTIYGEGDGSTTFALPNLIDRFLQGSATAGTYKAAGLPNITGKIQQRDAETGQTGEIWGHADSFITEGIVSGYTTRPYNYTLTGNSVSGGASIDGISFDASKSNSIYGNSTTVQPPALTMLPIIKY